MLKVVNHLTLNEATNPVQRYAILYPCTIQILEEGASSESKFKTVLGVLQDLKRKLVDESNNSDSVEDELVGTHPSESPESVQPGYVKFLNPLQANKKFFLQQLQFPSRATTKQPTKIYPVVTLVAMNTT
ncbi:hypothetical protein IFM89_036371 [Coptis chinensis]|uniref:Uncharacterized protein n=1 Tax=Coptis chinensis TaxID=261450 RepID=A0A835LLE5_9MAGN|nr:hypothetical protein IFM89_036371 [Coptis chinensis]